jgi:hypothetical protein
MPERDALDVARVLLKKAGQDEVRALTQDSHFCSPRPPSRLALSVEERRTRASSSVEPGPVQASNPGQFKRRNPQVGQFSSGLDTGPFGPKTVPVNSAITATVTIKAPITRAGELFAGRVPRPATITTVMAAAGSNTEPRPAYAANVRRASDLTLIEPLIPLTPEFNPNNCPTTAHQYLTVGAAAPRKGATTPRFARNPAHARGSRAPLWVSSLNTARRGKWAASKT